MANEVTVTNTLQVIKRSSDGTRTLIQYVSQPGAFTADMDGAKGPLPGAFTVTTTGKSVYLYEQLSTPGFFRVSNLDETNYVEMGIYDPQTDIAYPLLEIGPGESYVGKLTRNLQEQWSGSDAGTTGPENYLWFKADTASVVVLLEVFER